MSGYEFLLDTFETEIMKTVGVWESFPESAMEFRPALKSRTVIEQFEHQMQSEWRWMRDMLLTDAGDWNR